MCWGVALNCIGFDLAVVLDWILKMDVHGFCEGFAMDLVEVLDMDLILSYC